MSIFSPQISVNTPFPEQGFNGSIKVETDLFKITALITKEYQTITSLDFSGLRQKVIIEVSANNQDICMDLLAKIPSDNIFLDEEMLELQANSTGMQLEERKGFTSLNEEFIRDERGIHSFDSFKKYRVQLSRDSCLEIKTNIAFELALCLDTFISEYRKFMNKYWTYICKFGDLGRVIS